MSRQDDIIERGLIEAIDVRSGLCALSKETRGVVEIDFVLKDGRTGSTLWSEHVRNVSSGGRGDPLASAMAAAILRALPTGLHLLPLK